jgi:biotin-dependent carboxylase-like uncharacterized protein
VNALTVLDPGALTTVQDLGRPGWAHLGVPPSGALDTDALTLANRLVGNPPHLSGLEVLLGGLRLRADNSVRIALTGGLTDLVVAGSPRPWGEAVSVRGGDEIEVRGSPAGLRGWLAVAGGLVAAEVLGSSATDTLTGLGHPPLQAGDSLAVGRPSRRPGSGSAVPRRSETQATLTIRLGPRDDWFTAGAVARLTSTRYEVAPASNRIGIRLQSPEGSQLDRDRTEELPSEGLVTGAVQVPSSGQPLVFLADHPVTGGYPVIAVVEPGDLWKCAQLRPGDEVRFRIGR